jgi:tetratricopeptide (TPR) repeat protein
MIDTMENTRKTRQWPTWIRHAGMPVLGMGLLLLAGCATGGKVEVAVVEPEPVVATGPSVVRLAGGRAGFIITEVPKLDESSRETFAQAVDLMNNGAYDEAIDLLKQVIELSPEVTAPYIDIAIAYEQVGNPEEAEANLKIALELIPDHPVASNEYGLLCRRSGRFEEAREIYEKAIVSFPEYYPLHRNLGILCDLYLNDPVSALEHYRIYSEAMPEDRQVALWIADLSVRTGSD